MSTVWIVPFLMFLLVTTKAAVADADEISIATTPAMIALFMILPLDSLASSPGTCRGEPARRVSTKTERGAREVDLLPELVGLLKRHRADAFSRGLARPEDYVFTTATGNPLYFRNVSRDFATAADRAGLNREGLPKLTTHDLRHTAISRWIALGLDAVEAARQAGDTVETITKTYAHEFDRAKRKDEIRAKLAGTRIRLVSGD